jgi:hypothetical protein
LKKFLGVFSFLAALMGAETKLMVSLFIDLSLVQNSSSFSLTFFSNCKMLLKKCVFLDRRLLRRSPLKRQPQINEQKTIKQKTAHNRRPNDPFEMMATYTQSPISYITTQREKTIQIIKITSLIIQSRFPSFWVKYATFHKSTAKKVRTPPE